MSERLHIDYTQLPYLPREGIQTKGNNKFMTKSLFLESADEEDKPKAVWTLAEHEVEAYGRWYPSAWMAYIHATDEYDALRKIVGNVRHWEALKKWTNKKNGVKFIDLLADWQLEQAHIQRSQLRAALTVSAIQDGSTAAARTLLQMLDKQPVGRPTKPKAEEPGIPQDTIDSDHARVVALRARK